jgi:hypothetical protein
MVCKIDQQFGLKIIYYNLAGEQDFTAGKVTAYGLDDRALLRGGIFIFIFSTAFKPTLRPTEFSNM